MKTKHGLLLLVILALLGVLRILRPIEGFVDAATAGQYARQFATPPGGTPTPPGSTPTPPGGTPTKFAVPPPTKMTADDALKMLVELRDSNTKATEYINKKEKDDMNTLSKLLQFAKAQKGL